MSDENLLVSKQTVIFFLRGPISVLKTQAGPFEEGEVWVCSQRGSPAVCPPRLPSVCPAEGRGPTREPRPHLLDLGGPSAAAPTPLGTAAVPTVQAPRGFPGGLALGGSAVALGPKGWSSPRGFATGSAHALLGRRRGVGQFIPSHFCSQNPAVAVVPSPGRDKA